MIAQISSPTAILESTESRHTTGAQYVTSTWKILINLSLTISIATTGAISAGSFSRTRITCEWFAAHHERIEIVD